MYKVRELALAVALIALPASAPAQQCGTARGTFVAPDAGGGYHTDCCWNGQHKECYHGRTRAAVEQQENTAAEAQPGTAGFVRRPGVQAGILGESRVTGNVVDINRKTGKLTLKGNTPTLLVLQFPPESLRSVMLGEAVSADLSVEKEGRSHAIEPFDYPKPPLRKLFLLGRHQIDATVTSIDHDNGVLTAQPNGKKNPVTLTMQFRPQSIRNLNQGDLVTVDLGFTKGDVQGAA
jgi:hypothetical protein